MKLRDYFRGIRLVGYSPLAVTECEARIDAAAKSTLNPFAFGVVGHARHGRIYLRTRDWFEYNAKPVITGRLIERGDGCQLNLKYRAPMWAIGFFPIYYIMLGMFAVGSLSLDPTHTQAGQPGPLFVPDFFLILGVAPVLLHYVGTRGSNQQLETMLRFLEDVAEVGSADDRQAV